MVIKNQTYAQDLTTSSQNIIVSAQQAYLLCFTPFELSNAAFITSSAMLLGTPVPHVLYLHAENPIYAHLMSLATDCSTIPAMLLIHAHNPMTTSLAFYGTQPSIKNVPFADSHSQRGADLVTCRGGLVRLNPRLIFGPSTLLVMDFELGHTFTSSHQFKPQNIANMEHHKRS